MTNIYNCLWFAFISLVKSLLKHCKKHHTHKMSGIFHHRLTSCASMDNYLLLYTHIVSTCNTIPHIICAYTKFHLCIKIAVHFLLFQICLYMYAIWFCFIYMLFHDILKSSHIEHFFFNPLQIHLMSLYSSIPFFVIQILFMTCYHAVAFHIIYSKKFKAFNNA